MRRVALALAAATPRGDTTHAGRSVCYEELPGFSYDFCCGFPPEDPRFVRACFPEAPPPSEAAAGDAGEEDPDADVEIRACSPYGPVWYQRCCVETGYEHGPGVPTVPAYYQDTFSLRIGLRDIAVRQVATHAEACGDRECLCILWSDALARYML